MNPPIPGRRESTQYAALWPFTRLVAATSVTLAAMAAAVPYGAGPTVYIGLLLSTYFFLLYRQPKDDLFRPAGLFLSLYVLYTAFGYYHVLQMGEGAFSKRTELLFQVSSLLALIFVPIGQALGVRAVARWNRATSSAPLPGDRRVFLVLSIALLSAIAYPARQDLISLFSLSRTEAYSTWYLQKRVASMADQFGGLNWFCGDLAYFLIIAILVTPLFIRSKYRYAALFAAVVVVLLTLRAGHKSYAVFFGTAVLVHLNYQRKRVKYPLLVLCVVAGVFGTTLFSYVRHTTSLRQMGTEAVDLVSRDSRYVMPTKGGEFSSLVSEYMVLLEGINDGVTSISYGATILHDIGAFIPRFIWPSRPDPAQFLFMRCFHAGDFEKGAGVGFYIVTEAYWAFGLPGVALEAMIYGLFCAWWYGVIVKPWTDPLRALFYAWSLQIFLVPVVRQGFVLAFKNAIMYLGPIWLILWISAELRRRRSRTRPPVGADAAMEAPPLMSDAAIAGSSLD